MSVAVTPLRVLVAAASQRAREEVVGFTGVPIVLIFDDEHQMACHGLHEATAACLVKRGPAAELVERLVEAVRGDPSRRENELRDDTPANRAVSILATAQSPASAARCRSAR